MTVQGVKLNVDNPLVTTRHKGSMFFGIYENAERELATTYLDRALPAVEIGGSIGGVSCIVNRMLHRPEDHVVLECNPILLPTLRLNRDLNRARFAIEEAALAYDAETVSFAVSDHFMLGGRMGQTGSEVVVPSTTLSKVFARYGFDTINLISDCEGAEAELVENEAELLQSRVKWLIVETHPAIVGPDRCEGMIRALQAIGFRTREILRATVLAMENTGV